MEKTTARQKAEPLATSSKLGQSKPGDYVEVHLMHEIYEGTFLEVPESEKGIILLKLDTGYNIGFNRKDVLKIKVLRKFKPVEDVVEINRPRDKPCIAMIITGGTISSRLDPKSGAVSWLTSPEQLFKFYPGIFKHVNVSKVEVPFMKASEDMSSKDWQKIAKTAEKLLNDENIKGVIVTHGTDTLHYTASALSFFLQNLNKPVVLSYSQRSSDRGSSDAKLNLECAAIVAASDIAEVVLVGHGSTNDDYCYVLRGTKVRKLHSSRRDAFKPVNVKPIAKIDGETFTFYKLSDYKTKPKKETSSKLGQSKEKMKNKLKADAKFEEKVALIKFYPGQDEKILDYYIKNGYKGIVIETSGLGHVNSKWAKKIKEAVKKGIIVCAAAQTIYGRLDPYVYSNGRELLKTGIIYLEDMLSETALVKLGYVLAHPEWKNQIKEKMLENMAGELNDRLEK
ncbi:MAG: Glu-tRNA(Gln) amidotransferase subunit GatD [Candidatus Pacearchaeota archaeon]